MGREPKTKETSVSCSPSKIGEKKITVTRFAARFGASFSGKSFAFDIRYSAKGSSFLPLRQLFLPDVPELSREVRPRRVGEILFSY